MYKSITNYKIKGDIVMKKERVRKKTDTFGVTAQIAVLTLIISEILPLNIVIDNDVSNIGFYTIVLIQAITISFLIFNIFRLARLHNEKNNSTDSDCNTKTNNFFSLILINK